MINFDLHFPTVVAKSHDLEFTNKVLPIVQNILNNSDSKFWGYQTTYGDTPQNHLIYEQLNQHSFIKEKLKSLCKKYIETAGYDINLNTLNLYMFASRMKEGDEHGVHNHPNSLLSGVVYLNIEDNSSPIIFYNSNEIKNFIVHKTTQDTMFNTNHTTYNVKNGDILIWESWIKHGVPPNKKLNGVRETLVFNLQLKNDSQ
tara:strand:+ start:233 stop:835 length:603 start_codon:yes stop_codon:yes gene_type:complete